MGWARLAVRPPPPPPMARTNSGSGRSNSSRSTTSAADDRLYPSARPRRAGGSAVDVDEGVAMTPPQSRQLPPMPEIGRPEAYYAKLVHRADKAADVHSHEASKVGQYVTLALDPHLQWDEKLRYFKHALSRHCVPPPYPDDDVWMFYRNLADLVRTYAGQEALRLASAEDDLYAARVSMGQDREKIDDEAEAFFSKLLGSADSCPEWFSETDWAQLKLIRDQWI